MRKTSNVGLGDKLVGFGIRGFELMSLVDWWI